MKTPTFHRSSVFAFLAVALILTTVAASRNKLDARVRDLSDYFDSIQQDPAKAVPPEILAKAQGLIVMRNYKAGFIIGLSGGHGVAIVRNAANDTWGPIGFVKTGEGSFGFQAGAQRSDLVFVLMNDEGLSVLTNSNLKLGVDVRATIGPKSAGEQANLKTDSTPVLVYGDTRGLFGGAAIETGGVFPDGDDNKEYYDQKLSMSEILTGGKVEPTPAAKLLAEKIQKYAKSAVGAPAAAATGKSEDKDSVKSDKTPDPTTPAKPEDK